VAYVVTLAAFVLVLWIGRRYAVMESLEDPVAKEVLLRHLQRLDDTWPLVVVLVGGVAITFCWITIPQVL
jgi:hypothetical protein